jgi:hypothetical protein
MAQFAKKTFPSSALSILVAFAAVARAPSTQGAGEPVTLRIESTPSDARVFVRAGGHNGYVEEAYFGKVQKSVRVPFVVGDMIQIGKGRQARLAKVLEIVDSTHIRLDREVTWQAGDWVSFPFQGEAPDIGAYEFGDERRVIGPSWKRYPRRTFTSVVGLPGKREDASSSSSLRTSARSSFEAFCEESAWSTRLVAEPSNALWIKPRSICRCVLACVAAARYRCGRTDSSRRTSLFPSITASIFTVVE